MFYKSCSIEYWRNNNALNCNAYLRPHLFFYCHYFSHRRWTFGRVTIVTLWYEWRPSGFTVWTSHCSFSFWLLRLLRTQFKQNSLLIEEQSVARSLLKKFKFIVVLFVNFLLWLTQSPVLFRMQVKTTVDTQIDNHWERDQISYFYEEFSIVNC